MPHRMANLALVKTVQACNGGYCNGGYGGRGWMSSMMGNYGGYWMRFGPIGIFCSLIFWVLVIIAIVYLIKHLAKGGGEVKKDDAVEILKARYAKGEISKEDFEKIKKELEKM
jgi:putative membrane protein